MSDTQKTQLRGVLIAVWLLVFMVGGAIFWQMGGMSILGDGLPNGDKSLALMCIGKQEWQFNYPETIELVDYRKTSVRVYATVTAKNAFGVPGRHEVSCPLKDGEVDVTAIFRERLDALTDS